MFTGIIQEVGTVIELRKRGRGCRLDLKAPILSPGLKPGDSLAVSGVCLTVVEAKPPRLEMDVLAETVERSNLGLLKAGDPVNLEPSLKLGGELGGHLVTGHVDGVGKLVACRKTGEDWVLEVALPAELGGEVVEKGSIALEGVSLTVAGITDNLVSVHVIPYTCRNTNLGAMAEKSLLNVETDLIGKYVIAYLRKMGGDASKRPLDMSFLEEKGFL